MLLGRALVKVLESGQGWLDVVKIAKRIAKVTKVCIEQQGQFGVFYAKGWLRNDHFENCQNHLTSSKSYQSR